LTVPSLTVIPAQAGTHFDPAVCGYVIAHQGALRLPGLHGSLSLAWALAHGHTTVTVIPAKTGIQARSVEVLR